MTDLEKINADIAAVFSLPPEALRTDESHTATEVIARRREMFAKFAWQLERCGRAARWFRFTIPARGVKIPSRRRVKVWLKQRERAYRQ